MINKGDILELQNRRDIYKYISENPGTHERKISEKLNISRSTLRYHLNYLEKRDLIKGHSKEKYNRYFITQDIGKKRKEIISCLRSKTPLLIVFFLMTNSVSSRTELSEELDKSPSTISYHLKKLTDNNIIDHADYKNGLFILSNGKTLKHEKKKNEIHYKIVDPELIRDILVIFEKDPLGKKTLELMKDARRLQIKRYGKVPDNFKRNEDIDNVVELVYLMFPLPFCA